MILYPNPCDPATTDLKIKITVTRPAAQMELRIYTASFRRVYEQELGAINTMENTAIIEKERIHRLSSGIYYVVAAGTSDNGGKAVSKPQLLVVIK
jgi:hypothetical protein